MIKKIIAILFITITMVSCDAAKEAQGAYNMTNCKYSYQSVSGVSIAGINMSKNISPLQIPQILAIFAGGSSKSIPLNLTLNLNVENPHGSEAMFHGLQYIISVDDIQFTAGSVTQPLKLAGRETKVLPLSIGFDLATFMKGDSQEAVVEVAKNLAGIGSRESKLTIQVKPTFMIGNMPVTSPIYIPVNFTLGDKK